MSGHVLVHASVVLKERDRVLFVREEKDESRGKWNLPGGHVEFGETIAAAAQREAKEEVGVGVFLTDLLGVYTAKVRADGTSVRFVFNAHAMTGEAGPGDEITEVRWMSTDEARALADDGMVAPMILRRVLDDVDAGLSWPMAVLKEVSPGIGE
ncbi:MAG: NUDIX hydrolase [Planctomycetota bacterium]